jgi:hypothetical protein
MLGFVPGLLPGIHVLVCRKEMWIAGMSQDEPGHDEEITVEVEE